jgi:hypothetical protein
VTAFRSFVAFFFALTSSLCFLTPSIFSVFFLLVGMSGGFRYGGRGGVAYRHALGDVLSLHVYEEEMRGGFCHKIWTYNLP